MVKKNSYLFFFVAL